MVVESSYNGYWLVDGLKTAGFEVKLANTAALKCYDGLKHSGDEKEAAHLAHLLRLGFCLRVTFIHRPRGRYKTSLENASSLRARAACLSCQ